MTRVHIVLKHPRHPYTLEGFLSAGEVASCHSTSKAAHQEAGQKNQRGTGHYLYSVKSVTVKED